ncbi:MAG: Gfo/Idh/MocA family oxidoreductase [Spirochaetales bacterium]
MPVRYGVIGCGHRMRSLGKLVAQHPEVELAAAWDPDLTAVPRLAQIAGRPIQAAENWEAVVQADIDWIFVASPNVFHREQIEAALAAGKHVFAEKPLATTTEDCLALAHAVRSGNRILMTGFTLRYSGLYRKVKALLAEGRIGTIISIDATENLQAGHGAYIMTNWRRDYALAGSNVLEKCVHDLDLLNWFTESVPSRVAAFGGTNLFTPEHADLWERSVRFKDKGQTVASGLNPFTTEKSIEDNLVAILEYQNGMRAQFQLTSSNAIPERRMYISGTEGNLVLDLVTGKITLRTLFDQTYLTWAEAGWADGHGGGDEVLVRELVEAMVHGTRPSTGIEEGLRSTLVGIALDRARREKRVVELDELWREVS